jgi:hypothetical protein
MRANSGYQLKQEPPKVSRIVDGWLCRLWRRGKIVWEISAVEQ